jgi:hypothetical protein
MSHIFEDASKNYACLAIVEESAKLRFGSRSHDETDNIGAYVKSTVNSNRGAILGDPSHEKVAACAASGFALR